MLDDLDRLGGGVGAGGGVADQQGGVIEPDQDGGDAVGEPALGLRVEGTRLVGRFSPAGAGGALGAPANALANPDEAASQGTTLELTVRDRYSPASPHALAMQAAFIKVPASCEETRVGECRLTQCRGAAVYADAGVVRVTSRAPDFSLATAPGAAPGGDSTFLDTLPAPGQPLRSRPLARRCLRSR